MDFLTVVVGILLTLTFIYCLRTVSRRTKNLPPRPTPLPLIGSLHLLSDRQHNSLARLANTYAPLMLLCLGSIDTVVVSSADVAREVLQKQDLAFSSRSIPNAIHAHDHHKYSVVWLPVSPRWRSLRKAMNSNIFTGSRLDTNQHLRRRKVEELITYCCQCSRTSAAVDIGAATFRTILNSLSNTIFSRDLTDPFLDSVKEFRETVLNISAEAGKPNMVDFFPSLARLDPQGIRRRTTVNFRKVLELFGGLIGEKLEKGKSRDDEASDVIDVLKMSNERPKEINRAHIERLCLDLFVADTSSSTVEWAMAEALRNPETMKKAKDELEQVTGKGKPIEEADIPCLPYLRSMLKETMRLHPPVPFRIPRTVDQDVELLGRTVPRGSRIFVNVWAIGRDPDIWENPLEFNPNRFLESEADVWGTDFELIPFGAGRRICPGLPLAMRVVPVMLGSLVNCFDWKVEGGEKTLDMEEKFGITLEKAQPLRAVPIAL